jgi:hypothetical protein
MFHCPTVPALKHRIKKEKTTGLWIEILVISRKNPQDETAKIREFGPSVQVREVISMGRTGDFLTSLAEISVSTQVLLNFNLSI